MIDLLTLNISKIILSLILCIGFVYILTRVISLAIIKSINQGYIEKLKTILKLIRKDN